MTLALTLMTMGLARANAMLGMRTLGRRIMMSSVGRGQRKSMPPASLMMQRSLNAEGTKRC